MRLFTENSKSKRMAIKVEWNSDTGDVYCERLERTVHIFVFCPSNAVVYSLCYSLLSVGSTKSSPTQHDSLSRVSVHMHVEFTYEFTNISYTAQFWDRITSAFNTNISPNPPKMLFALKFL
jgi:hypothetical protein